MTRFAIHPAAIELPPTTWVTIAIPVPPDDSPSPAGRVIADESTTRTRDSEG